MNSSDASRPDCGRGGPLPLLLVLATSGGVIDGTENLALTACLSGQLPSFPSSLFELKLYYGVLYIILHGRGNLSLKLDIGHKRFYKCHLHNFHKTFCLVTLERALRCHDRSPCHSRETLPLVALKIYQSFLVLRDYDQIVDFNTYNEGGSPVNHLKEHTRVGFTLFYAHFLHAHSAQMSLTTSLLESIYRTLQQDNFTAYAFAAVGKPHVYSPVQVRLHSRLLNVYVHQQPSLLVRHNYSDLHSRS